MIRRVLLSEGYSVLTAATGGEAVDLARAHQVDLVMLDLNMPGQGGWDAFAKLSSLDPGLGIIIITARPNQLFTALAAGVDALMEKPFDYNKMLETVQTVLEEPTATRRERLAGTSQHLRYIATGAASAH
jgi:DNA-binding response OmpR family regulator